MKHTLQLLGSPGLGLAQVALRVFDRVSEHEETVSDRFELLAGDDELVLAEAELERAVTGFEVALSARPLAVQPRSSPAGRDRERPSAPATRVLRHSDDIRRGALTRHAYRSDMRVNPDSPRSAGAYPRRGLRCLRPFTRPGRGRSPKFFTGDAYVTRM
jgi:hypothetical protein